MDPQEHTFYPGYFIITDTWMVCNCEYHMMQYDNRSTGLYFNDNGSNRKIGRKKIAIKEKGDW